MKGAFTIHCNIRQKLTHSSQIIYVMGHINSRNPMLTQCV